MRRCRCCCRCSVAAGKLHVCEPATVNQCLDQCTSMASTAGTAPHRPRACSFVCCSGCSWRSCRSVAAPVTPVTAWKLGACKQTSENQRNRPARPAPLNVQTHTRRCTRAWRSRRAPPESCTRTPMRNLAPSQGSPFCLGRLAGGAASAVWAQTRSGRGARHRGSQAASGAWPGGTPPRLTSGGTSPVKAAAAGNFLQKENSIKKYNKK